MAKALIFDGKHLVEKTWTGDSYEFLSNAVGGFIERIPLSQFESKNIDVWCNEDGKFKDLETTVLLVYKDKIYDNVVGNVVFTKHDGNGGTIGLTDDDIKYIRDIFVKNWYLDLNTKKSYKILEY